MTAKPLPDRTNHPFHMYEMVYDIPSSLRSTLESVKASPNLWSELRGRKLIFTGCGTAYFSGWLASEILRQLNPGGGVSLQSIPPLELMHLALDSSYAVVGVSNSGVTKTTADTIAYSRKKGAYTLALTHARGPVTEASDAQLVVGSSPDSSRCHTKCYTDHAAGLVALACKAVASAEADTILDRLAEAPNVLSRYIKEVDSVCRELAEANINRATHFFAGAGADKVNAQEAALKVAESSFLPSFGYELEQFMHGPWVSVDTRSVVFVFDCKQYHRRVSDLVKAAANIGASVIQVGGDAAADKAEVISLPSADYGLAPLYSIVPAYLYAYYASVTRGRNPDMLRYEDPSYWNSRLIIFPPGTH